ncbi:hypothetical protein [Paenibacillus beijingensis]|uniref:hypothetical protein n=1 Tax=Paenibacillus beijingensis TaxID=1126833 RepID=UPI000A52F49F|nr:hypothetical protein [Paenibacillus beijingensis]
MRINTDVVLEGQTVRLVPMETGHKAKLSRILISPEIWEFTWRTMNTAKELDRVLTYGVLISFTEVLL